MIIKLLNSAFILFAVYMGITQGLAMITGKPEIMTIFSKWHFSRNAIMINGIVTVLSALFILLPKTFLFGNFLMAAGILLIICFYLLDRNLKGAAIELPFFLMNGLIIYLHHPLAK